MIKKFKNYKYLHNLIFDKEIIRIWEIILPEWMPKWRLGTTSLWNTARWILGSKKLSTGRVSLQTRIWETLVTLHLEFRVAVEARILIKIGQMGSLANKERGTSTVLSKIRLMGLIREGGLKPRQERVQPWFSRIWICKIKFLVQGKRIIV